MAAVIRRSSETHVLTKIDDESDLGTVTLYDGIFCKTR